MDGEWIGVVMIGIVLFFVVVLGVCAYDSFQVQPQIMARYSSQYDVKDVRVFLEAIDADWHDFEDSITLRKTYEDVRDGKQSLAEIKKKQNDTTYIPIVIPTGR